MEFNHNSSITKNASEIFGLNAFDKPLQDVSGFIQPTKEIESTINVVRSASATATIYTTPSNRDFFLTNIYIQATGEATVSAGTGQMQFTTEDNQVITILTDSDATDNATAPAVSIQYPLRGVLLKRGSAIAFSATAVTSCGMIAGYLGDDRS